MTSVYSVISIFLLFIMILSIYLQHFRHPLPDILVQFTGRPTFVDRRLQDHLVNRALTKYPNYFSHISSGTPPR